MWDLIATPLGWVMKFIYDLVNNYGVALLLFTIVTKLALLPLTIKQQKSTAKQSAYQPMIQELQKKHSKDKAKLQEEMMKMQQEYGYSPLSGCLPMAVNMVILMGLIQVIYKPLRFIMGVPGDVYKILESWGRTAFDTGYPDTAIVSAIQNGDPAVIEKVTSVFAENGVSANIIDNITNFNFTFLGIDLTRVPDIGDWSSMASIILILVPIVSAITMIVQTTIMQKVSGQEMQGAMKYMPHMMSVMFIFIGFSVPTGVSLYWIYTNIFGLIQALLLKKLYDPAKMKIAFAEEVEAKKREKRAKKTIVITEKTGEQITKEVNEKELFNIRLAKARELEEKRYSGQLEEEIEVVTEKETLLNAEPVKEKASKKKSKK